MSARATNLDVTAFSLEGTSVIDNLRGGVSVAGTAPSARVDSIVNPYESECPTGGNSVTLNFTLTSTTSAPCRVTNLNVTTLTIGGTAVLANLQSGTINVSCTLSEGKGAADVWAFPVVTKSRLTANLVLKIPTTSFTVLHSAFYAADTTGLDLVVSFVIGSATITAPMLLTSLTHEAAENGIQTVSCEFVGQAADSGDFPTSPTGTTTLIEKALNAPGTPLTLVYTTRDPGGFTYGGEFVFESLTINIPEAGTVDSQFTMRSQGAITATLEAP